MSTSGDLPPDQAARVVAVMRQLRDERFDGKNVELGRALGRSGASVGSMLAANPKHGPSLKTAQRVAELAGVSLTALLEGTASTGAAVPDRYPPRASALRRLLGMLHPDVEERVRAVVLDETDPPLTEAQWIKLALRWEDEHREDEPLRKLAKT